MVAFQDLTPAAQTVAEREFMAFYIRHFKRDDLEVLTELASDSQQAMINRVLRTNNFMTVDQLVAVSLPLTSLLLCWQNQRWNLMILVTPRCLGKRGWPSAMPPCGPSKARSVGDYD